MIEEKNMNWWGWLSPGMAIGAWEPLMLQQAMIGGNTFSLMGARDVGDIVEATNNTTILF
jgi:hypothetical protein